MWRKLRLVGSMSRRIVTKTVRMPSSRENQELAYKQTNEREPGRNHTAMIRAKCSHLQPLLNVLQLLLFCQAKFCSGLAGGTGRAE